MQTLIVYFDESKSSCHRITPHNQGASFDAKSRFDGNWKRLAEQLVRNYHSFEVI